MRPLLYVVRHGEQCLIGLGWGDGENIDAVAAIAEATHLPLSDTGTLPRAAESVSGSQINLVEAALAQPCGNTILCSHFTLVNYCLEAPLAEPGKIVCQDGKSSRYDHGTVKKGRNTLFENWLGKNAFQMTLGGHSHRVGLYRCQYILPIYDMVHGGVMIPSHLHTRGYHPEDSSTPKVAWGQKTKVLVSASTGPIPKQNRQGEMSGQGMERPSGSRICFAGGESITLVKSDRRSTAIPRFCVACDYLDVLGGGFWEYFRAVDGNGTFEMKPHWVKIHPKLGDQAKRTLIESVTLCMVGEGGTTSVQASKIKDPNGAVALAGDALGWKFGSVAAKIEFHGESLSAMFLSIKFNGSGLDQKLFGHYNFASPWNIQVGIYGAGGGEVGAPVPTSPNPVGRAASMGRRQNATNKPASWHIMRHKKYGEVPYFVWRKQCWPGEYKFNLKKKSKS